MTMFRELYALAMTATLTMIVSADKKTGKLTISVLPKPRKDVGEPALTKDLTLTASPEDFDAGFVAALQGYREVRDSLTEQAEATREVLEAAKSVSVKQATEAMTKAKTSKPTQSAQATCATAVQEVRGDDDIAVEPSGENETSTAALGESLQLFD